MDFDLTEEQRLLADAARRFVRHDSPVARARRMREDARGWEPDVWRKMGELGWLGLSLPERAGGAGGSMVDVMVLLEALGAGLVPEPYIASAVLAAQAIRHAGDADQQSRWLAPMIEGRTSLALAWMEPARRYALRPEGTVARREGNGYRLDGRKIWVDNGHAADALVVSALAPDGPTLFVVPRSAQGLAVTRRRTIEEQPSAEVRLDAVRVGAEDRLGPEGSALPALERALDCAAAAAVAEGLGVAGAAFALTLSHLQTREQFGVKIGTFQVLQHRAVDMFVELEMLRSMAILAAVECENEHDDTRRGAVSAAKAQLSAGGRLVVQQAIQLHGGIGITDEHDVGLFFKRMTALAVLYGDETHHLERLAAQPSFLEGVDRPAPG
ncbi:MAG: acyl-CoA dehydrogenase family protein [Myxococcales bacterium]|nr:acyl-CoA dehydrogenase family protein [Myxococcales bacterium]